jgi:hypothetical protein
VTGARRYRSAVCCWLVHKLVVESTRHKLHREGNFRCTASRRPAEAGGYVACRLRDGYTVGPLSVYSSANGVPDSSFRHTGGSTQKFSSAQQLFPPTSSRIKHVE